MCSGWSWHVEYFIAANISLCSVNLFMLTIWLFISFNWYFHRISAVHTSVYVWHHGLASHFCYMRVQLVTGTVSVLCRKVAVNAWSSKDFHFSFVCGCTLVCCGHIIYHSESLALVVPIFFRLRNDTQFPLFFSGCTDKNNHHY